jgi:rfaE bifunctional protein kinase chain/domain
MLNVFLPEAPVPVVALDKNELRIGGAGNVALNLVELGARVSIFSAIGEDEDGKRLDKLLTESGIDTSYMICSAKRKTTNKVRIISRNQQMMRLDSETTSDLPEDIEFALLERVKDFIINEKPSVMVFEDYNKGVLTEAVIQKVIELCKEHEVITTVDPKKKNFFSYKSVDYFQTQSQGSKRRDLTCRSTKLIYQHFGKFTRRFIPNYNILFLL